MRVRHRLLTLVCVLLPLGACGDDDGANTNNWFKPKDAGPDTSAEGGLGGNAGASGTAGHSGSCAVKTCAQLGAECGSLPDNCGGVATCGDCPQGKTCGGGGQNKCGTGTCNNKTCAQLGAQCGWASDSCSKAIDCGSCGAGQTCGVPGNPNYCSGGTGGKAGSSGAAGSSGTAGSAGTSGSSGTAGTAGQAGSAGTSGSAGQGGTAGASGQAGNGGTAGAPCTPDCFTAGSTTCVSGINGTHTCGNFDSDVCLDWSTVTYCESGTTCSDGICKSGPCTNDCNNSGAKECLGSDSFRTCGNFDSDTCLEWQITACQSGMVCSGNGVCSCPNNCPYAGAKQCSGNYAYQTCVQNGACLEWQTTSCDGTDICQNGACVCQNTCTAGTFKCDGKYSHYVCGNYDADSCTEWSPNSTDCQSWEICESSSGQCKCDDDVKCLIDMSGEYCQVPDRRYVYHCQLDAHGCKKLVPDHSCPGYGNTGHEYTCYQTSTTGITCVCWTSEGCSP